MEQDKEVLKAFQFSWAYHKYWVMLHSQKAYEEIRQLAKYNIWNKEKQLRYEEILVECAQTEPTRGSIINTCLHVWGYFKKEATDEEKIEVFTLLNSQKIELKKVLELLKNLSFKYKKCYLINSKIFEENSL